MLAIDLAGAEIRHDEEIIVLLAATREAVIADGRTPWRCLTIG
jgi:hypothetical protein